MRGTIRDLVEGIDPFDGVEADHRQDVLRWIDSGAEIFRRAKPATPPRHLVSYCVLVDPTGGDVLLVDHRDAGLWLPTGGHVDADEHPAETARRELAEELGVSAPFLPGTGERPVLVTVTETGGRSTSHTDVSLWFALAGEPGEPIAHDGREFVEARWWPAADIVHGPGSRFDPHLPRFVDKLQRVATG